MLSNEDNISFLEQTIIEIEFLLSDTGNLNFYNPLTCKEETLYIDDFKRDFLKNVVEPYNEYKESPQFYYDSSYFKVMREQVLRRICENAFQLLNNIKLAKICSTSKQVKNENGKQKDRKIKRNKFISHQEAKKKSFILFILPCSWRRKFKEISA